MSYTDSGQFDKTDTKRPSDDGAVVEIVFVVVTGT